MAGRKVTLELTPLEESALAAVLATVSGGLNSRDRSDEWLERLEISWEQAVHIGNINAALNAVR